MAFHEVRFPASLSFGALGGPQRRTDVVTLANGFEERNTPWAHSRRVYDAGLGMRSIDDLQKLVGFFEARNAFLSPASASALRPGWGRCMHSAGKTGLITNPVAPPLNLPLTTRSSGMVTARAWISRL